jgi:hypothetical protein
VSLREAWQASWIDLAVRLGAVGTPFDAALRLPMSLAQAHFESREWERLSKVRDARDKLSVTQVQATNNVVRAIGALARSIG